MVSLDLVIEEALLEVDCLMFQRSILHLQVPFQLLEVLLHRLMVSQSACDA